MNAIFAVNLLNGFGTGTDMPWPRSSQDLKRFRDLTTGNTVVMGANTWLSDMPKPLPNRRNCVLSASLQDPRCEVFSNITHLMMNLHQDETVFVIGGTRVLWQLQPLINRVYLTRFKSANTAAVTLDTSTYLKDFTMESREELEDHVFDIYRRV